MGTSLILELGTLARLDLQTVQDHRKYTKLYTRRPEMRRIRLTRQEKAMEEALAKGDYVKVSDAEFSRIAEALAARKKDAILHIRVNSKDLNHIKQKAQKLGIKYQTFISEVIRSHFPFTYPLERSRFLGYTYNINA